jgi:hypothetical protein
VDCVGGFQSLYVIPTGSCAIAQENRSISQEAGWTGVESVRDGQMSDTRESLTESAGCSLFPKKNRRLEKLQRPRRRTYANSSIASPGGFAKPTRSSATHAWALS